SLFAHHPIDKNDVRTALNTWKHLRLRVLIARVLDSWNHVILSKAKDLDSSAKVSSVAEERSLRGT
ncbi:MAG TPA: hypothetical protein VJ821_12425, partial [Anaerolineales bacterium]|nr:hypothetical protein [Anaerolineales bacterium]